MAQLLFSLSRKIQWTIPNYREIFLETIFSSANFKTKFFSPQAFKRCFIFPLMYRSYFFDQYLLRYEVSSRSLQNLLAELFKISFRKVMIVIGLIYENIKTAQWKISVFIRYALWVRPTNKRESTVSFLHLCQIQLAQFLDPYPSNLFVSSGVTGLTIFYTLN